MGNMKTKKRRRQNLLRNTVVSEGCSARGRQRHQNPGQWSAQFIEGATESTTDLKLKLGDTQRIMFTADSPPPCYTRGIPVEDLVGSKPNRKRNMRSAQRKMVDPAGVYRLVSQKYAGKVKGVKHLLWERGLYMDEMSAAEGACFEKRG